MIEPRDKIIKPREKMVKPHEIMEEPHEIIMELHEKWLTRKKNIEVRNIKRGGSNMSVSKNRVDEFLLAAQVMIENSLSDDGVKTALADYGFTENKLTELKNLYQEVAALHNARKKEYGEQVAATSALNGIWEAADRRYIKTLKVARVAFRNKVKADKAIMLYGDRKQSLSGWLEQARAFYSNILNDPDMLASIGEYGYTPEKLKEEALLIDEVTAKHLEQKKEIGEAQESTQARDEKLDELAMRLSGLRVVAKVALDENPQILEKFGILARTTPKAQPKQAAGQSWRI